MTFELEKSKMPKDTASHDSCHIRYADENDLSTVLKLYMAALSEIQDQILPISPEKCAKTVLFAWSQAPCILIEKAGQIVGFAGLKTARPDHSDHDIITEYMFYIQPEHRSLGLAKKLSDAAQAVADRFKLPLYFTHYLHGKSVEHKGKFLNRWGYKPYAVSCTYGVINGR